MQTINVYKGEETPMNLAGRITVSPCIAGSHRINLAILGDSARLTLFSDEAGIGRCVDRCREIALASNTMADHSRRARVANEARAQRQAMRARRHARRR